MRILFAFLLTSCFAFTSFSQESINWMTWDQAAEAMKTQKRKIFIDVYTDWCGWCKKMDAGTFKDPSVVAYMNKNYYAVKFNAEMKDTVKFNNVSFFNPVPGGKRGTHTFAASLLDSRMSYPSFVILDENFTRLHIMAGYKKPDPLMGNLMFFGSNQHQQYNQYFYKSLVQQQQEQQQAVQQQTVQQQPKKTP